MAKRLIVSFLLLVVGLPAFCQEESVVEPVKFSKFSIEVGTGLQPILTDYLSMDWDYKSTLADKGLGVDRDGALYPMFSLSAVWRPYKRSEFLFTLGESWIHHRVVQYSVFGTDPKGKPRYDLYDGSPAGWTDSPAVTTTTIQYRQIWNPKNAVTLYSGIGIGLIIDDELLACPEFTLLGARYGGEHFYFFAEGTLGLIATFAHLGVGWHF